MSLSIHNGAARWRAVGLLAAALAAGCARQQPADTELAVYGITGRVQVATANAREVRALAAGLSNAIHAVQAALDPRSAESELSRLNKVSGSARLTLSRPVFRVLDLGKHYHEITGGRFDYTTGDLAQLWASATPDDELIATALDRCGMGYVELAENGSVIITKPGVRIQLGSLAAAYAVDVATVDARDETKSSFVLSYGPATRREGRFPADETPHVALAMEDNGVRKPLGLVSLADHAALAQRSRAFSRASGRLPVIDPRNGKPAEGAFYAAVIGPLAVRASAFAEALLMDKPEESAALLDAFYGYEAMAVEVDPPRVWMTPGFRAAFRPADTAMAIREWTAAPPAEPAVQAD